MTLTPSEIIELLGGPTAVAKLLDIKPPSVIGWRSCGIPDDKLIRLAPLLEERGVATRKELLPATWRQIWPELATKRRKKTANPIP